mmetsp:Transcript_28960/g.90672  ORF Transcript_28960/g.90672 Transcript_28960/m.90672 type:complete len:265 (+) Transcript_28960:83-877(+)
MRVRVRVAQLLLLLLLLIALPLLLWRRAPAEATVASSVVAIEISGAARGRSSLAATAAALDSHVMQPAAGRGFTVLVWLEDEPSEAFLESAFGRTPTLTRLRAQRQLPPDLATPTDTLLAAAGLPEALGRVERNTLRMLRKMAGCEWLRRHAEAEHAFPSATLVLRTRPGRCSPTLETCPRHHRTLEPCRTGRTFSSPPRCRYRQRCLRRRARSTRRGAALPQALPSTSCSPRRPRRRPCCSISSERRSPTPPAARSPPRPSQA